MPATPADLYDMLDSLGISFSKYDHPAFHTVEQSRELRGCIPGAHCKTLFLKDRKGMLYLVVCLEHRRLDMKRLAKAIGSARLSFGRAELLWERLGVRPGAVTPFALINDRDNPNVKVILDRQMLEHELLNYHPLHNEATIAISREGFGRFLEACGHQTMLLEFSDATPGKDLSDEPGRTN